MSPPAGNCVLSNIIGGLTKTTLEQFPEHHSSLPATQTPDQPFQKCDCKSATIPCLNTTSQSGTVQQLLIENLPAKPKYRHLKDASTEQTTVM